MYGKNGLGRVLVFTVTAYVLAVLGISAYAAWKNRQYALDAADARLSMAVKTLPLLLAPDFHDRAIDANSIALDEELRNRGLFNRFSREQGLSWVYTLVEHEGKLVFSAPSVSEDEALERDRWYWYPYEDAPEVFIHALETREITFANYKDEWGVYRSAILPVRSPSGRIYLACADIGTGDIRHHAVNAVLFTISGGVLLIMLMVPFVLLFVRRLLSDKKELEHLNAKLAEDVHYAQTRLSRSERIRAISLLSASAAHDLNNTLMYIQGNVSLMRLEADLDPELQRIAADIESTVQGSIAITRELLECAREDHQIPPVFPIADCMRREADRFSRLQPTANVECGRMDTDLFASFAEARFERGLRNLFKNALQAAVPGRPLRIRLELLSIVVRGEHARRLELVEGNHALVVVMDNGRGMGKEVLEQIFEPLFTTREGYEGHGLGLAGFQAALRLGGGAIDADSVEGFGTSFRIYLPLAAGIGSMTDETTRDRNVPHRDPETSSYGGTR